MLKALKEIFTFDEKLQKTLIWVTLGATVGGLQVIIFGLILPALFSAKSDIAAALGVILIIVNVIAVFTLLFASVTIKKVEASSTTKGNN